MTKLLKKSNIKSKTIKNSQGLKTLKTKKNVATRKTKNIKSKSSRVSKISKACKTQKKSKAGKSRKILKKKLINQKGGEKISFMLNDKKYTFSSPNSMSEFLEYLNALIDDNKELISDLNQQNFVQVFTQAVKKSSFSPDIKSNIDTLLSRAIETNNLSSNNPPPVPPRPRAATNFGPSVTSGTVVYQSGPAAHSPLSGLQNVLPPGVYAQPIPPQFRDIVAFLPKLKSLQPTYQALVIDIDTILKPADVPSRLRLIELFQHCSYDENNRSSFKGTCELVGREVGNVKSYFHDYDYLVELLSSLRELMVKTGNIPYVYFASDKYSAREIIPAFIGIPQLETDILIPLLRGSDTARIGDDGKISRRNPGTSIGDYAYNFLEKYFMCPTEKVFTSENVIRFITDKKLVVATIKMPRQSNDMNTNRNTSNNNNNNNKEYFNPMRPRATTLWQNTVYFLTTNRSIKDDSNDRWKLQVKNLHILSETGSVLAGNLSSGETYRSLAEILAERGLQPLYAPVAGLKYQSLQDIVTNPPDVIVIDTETFLPIEDPQDNLIFVEAIAKFLEAICNAPDTYFVIASRKTYRKLLKKVVLGNFNNQIATKLLRNDDRKYLNGSRVSSVSSNSSVPQDTTLSFIDKYLIAHDPTDPTKGLTSDEIRNNDESFKAGIKRRLTASIRLTSEQSIVFVTTHDNDMSVETNFQIVKVSPDDLGRETLPSPPCSPPAKRPPPPPPTTLSLHGVTTSESNVSESLEKKQKEKEKAAAVKKANYDNFLQLFKEDMTELKEPVFGRSPFQQAFNKIKSKKGIDDLLVDAFDIYLFDFDKTITSGCVDTTFFPITDEAGTRITGLTIEYLQTIMPDSVTDKYLAENLGVIRNFVKTLFGEKNGYFFVKFVRYLMENNKKIAIVTLGKTDIILKCLEILFKFMTKEKNSKYVNPFYNPYTNRDYAEIMSEISMIDQIESRLSGDSVKHTSGVILSLHPNGKSSLNSDTSPELRKTHIERAGAQHGMYKKNKMIRRLVFDLSDMSSRTDRLSDTEMQTWFRRTIYFDDDHENIDGLIGLNRRNPKQSIGMPINGEFLADVSGIKIGQVKFDERTSELNKNSLNITKTKFLPRGQSIECTENGFGISIQTILMIQNYLGQSGKSIPQSLNMKGVIPRIIISSNDEIFSDHNHTPLIPPDVLFTKTSR